MKPVKKIIIAITVLSVMALACAGCSRKKPNNDDVPPPPDNGIIRDDIDTDVLVSPLAKDGKSDYSIVIGKYYTETEYFAATELQNFIFKASGARLPLTVETTVQYSRASKVISVGGTDILKTFDGDMDYSQLNGDGFIIRTGDNSLFINGANDRGTLYGVYDWLEKAIGVKFLTAETTYVPKLETVNIFATDIVQVPAFPIRMYLSGPLYGDSLFLARMRMGCELVNADSKYGGKVQWNTSSPHNTLSYVPTSVYYTASNKEQNAHMYSLSNGVPVDLCMTDGITDDGKIDESMDISAFKVALNTLKQEIMRTDKQCTNFIFCQEDHMLCCQCDDCLAAETKYMRSGMNIRFANLLAEEANKWSKEEYDGRTVNVVIFAYYYSTNAPVDQDGNILDETCVPNENVYIRFAPINAETYYSFTDETKNIQYGNTINNWAKVTPNIMLWTYHTYYTDFAWYYPTVQTFKDNLMLYKSIGAEYVLMQSDYINSTNWQDRINLYVASKMLWNPDRDVNALRDEFVKYYYGDAAEAITDVIGRLDEKMYEASLEGTIRFQIYDKSIMNPGNYSIGFLEQIVNILDGAIAEIQTSNADNKDELIRRIKEVKVTPMFMIVHNVKTYYADSRKVYDTVKEFIELSEETGFVVYSEGKTGPNDLRNEYGIRN